MIDPSAISLSAPSKHHNTSSKDRSDTDHKKNAGDFRALVNASGRQENGRTGQARDGDASDDTVDGTDSDETTKSGKAAGADGRIRISSALQALGRTAVAEAKGEQVQGADADPTADVVEAAADKHASRAAHGDKVANDSSSRHLPALLGMTSDVDTETAADEATAALQVVGKNTDEKGIGKHLASSEATVETAEEALAVVDDTVDPAGEVAAETPDATVKNGEKDTNVLTPGVHTTLPHSKAADKKTDAADKSGSVRDVDTEDDLETVEGAGTEENAGIADIPDSHAGTVAHGHKHHPADSGEQTDALADQPDATLSESGDATVDAVALTRQILETPTDHAHERSSARGAAAEDDKDARVERMTADDDIAMEEAEDATIGEPFKSAKESASNTQSSNRTDFVTVLEARRFLGISGSANTGALASAIQSDPSWQAARSAALDGSQPTGPVNTLKLHMNPGHLGNMIANLRLTGDTLTVEVKVETAEAYRHLANDHDGLVRALKDQGFNIDQVTVQLTANAKPDANQDNGSQSGNGQNLREGQGENARQRDDSQRRSANQSNWGAADGSKAQNGSSAGGGTPDAGGLYL